MKIPMLPLLTAATAIGAGTTASADLLVVDDIPVTDVLVSRGDESPAGSAGIQQAFAFRPGEVGSEGSRGRGQSFLMDVNDGSAYDISSITVALNNAPGGNGTQAAGSVEFTVFEWLGANADDFSTWDAGTGGTDGAVVFSETFAVAAGFDYLGTQLLQISLGAGELQLSEDTAYGFFFRYSLDDYTGLTADVSLAFDSDNGAADGGAGALLNTNVNANPALADNGQSTTRDLNYFITGTVVPEPGSLALLGLGGLLIARRRRA